MNNIALHYHEIRQTLFLLVIKIIGVEVGLSLFDFLLSRLSLAFGFHEIYMNTWNFFLSHLINVIWLVFIVLRWANTYYIINSKEISITTGIIHKRKMSYDIRGIQSSEVDQGFLGRIFKYGTIHLQNPLIQSDIFLPYISNPHFYLSIIEDIHKEALRKAPLSEVILPKK